MATSIDTDLNIAIKGDTSDINSKLDQAGQKAKQMGDKASAAGDKAKGGMEKAKAGADKARIGFGVAAVAVQGFTSQIAGLGQAVLDFESKVVALNKTIVGLESQELALTRMQEDLNDAVMEGTISQRDYQRALEDITIQFRNVQLETQNVAAETNKLNGEYVSFGINAVGAIAQITIAFVAMGGSIGSIIPAIVTGIKLVGSTLWTIAKHPVFLIITAGILAWELGLKSIVEDLTGIADLGIFSNMQKAFDGLTTGDSSMQALDNQTASFTETVKEQTPWLEKQAGAMDDVGNSASNARKQIDGLAQSTSNLQRSGGFRAGPGQSLSESINREANAIEVASARTLAAASLHQALEDGGFSGDQNGSSVSGFLTTTLESMQAAGRTKNSFTNSSQVFGGSTGGVSLGSQRFGGRSLTRSNRRRRSGRNRNAKGRGDKLSVQFMNARNKLNTRLDREFGLDFDKFAGVSFKRKGNRRGGTHRQAAIQQHLSALETGEARGRERINKFNRITEGAGLEESLGLINIGFDSTRFDVFNANAEFTNQIQDVIQARNFFNKRTNIDRDSLETEGVSGLLNIKEFGYRELNEQLAFQGEEQFMTVGT